MLLNKVLEKGIDLFILIKDDMYNFYEPHPYMVHADYNSFQLVFKFEDWTGIIDDGKTHIYTIAEYSNADDSVLCKWQDEDFDKLLDKVKEWNDTHRFIFNKENKKKFNSFCDYVDTLPEGSTIWTYAMNFAKKLHNEGKNIDEYLDEVINSVENVKTKVKDYDV